MDNFYFKSIQEIENLGIKVLTARIIGINTTNYIPDFEIWKDNQLDKVKEYWVDNKLEEDSILKGFRYLHEKVGRSYRKYIASPEVLLNLLVTRDRFPKINPLVDIYNLISIKSRLALGAHDISKISVGVTLRLTNGTETFIPLGKNENEIIQPGEYAYVDEDNQIICRLEVIQCNATKITPATKDVFLIVQGNNNTEYEYVQNTLSETCDLIRNYCGGEIIFL